MAGLRFRATTGQVATGTSAKTIMQIVAASNHRVVIPRFEVGFEGVSNTDAPILTEVVVQTTAGTMTSLTLVKDNSEDGETLQTTAQHTASAEPTTTSTLYAMFIHPQTARVINGPFIVPGGTRVGVRVTSANNVDCVVTCLGEE